MSENKNSSAFPQDVTAKDRFLKLDANRNEVLRRAEEASSLTLPSVFPKKGATENTKLSNPYQALGARAVNTLASKITLALFPANTAFFKTSVAEQVDVTPEQQSELTEAFSKLERTVANAMEASTLRQTLSLLTKHLIVTGNGLLDVDAEGLPRFFSLRNYVVQRDGAGRVLECVVVEQVAPLSLSAEQQTLLEDDQKNKPDEDVEIYTWMRLYEDEYHVIQQINGKEVPGSDGTYPTDSPRFIVCRWSLISGSDYGRGLVDEYISDFVALDDLSRDLLKASVLAAKVVLLVKPGSILRKKELQDAESGDVLSGERDDVGTIGLDKYADFRITLERIRDISESISRAFLMNSSIQRDAERVTAEEVRYMAQELEDAHGGVYSILSQELQAPLVRRYIKVLEKKGEIPALPKSDTRITITTGLDALGRGHDLNKLIGYLKTMGELVGIEVVQQRMNFDSASARVAASYGVDITDIWKTPEQVSQDQQSAMGAGIISDSAPGVLQTAMKGVMPNG